MLKDLPRADEISAFLDGHEFILNWEEEKCADYGDEYYISDADLLISVYNDHKALYKLTTIKNILEYRYKLYIHLVYEQIGDQMMMQNDPYLTADFYVFDDEDKYLEMIR